MAARTSNTIRKIPAKGQRRSKKGSKAKSEEVVLKASKVTKLSVSVTNSSRELCPILGYSRLLLGNGIKCRYCRCRSHAPSNNQPNQTKLQGFGGCIQEK